MLKLALIIAGIIAVAMVLFCINIILRGGTFRSQHVGQSEAMRKEGIHCVQSMDRIDRMADPHAAVKRERGNNN